MKTILIALLLVSANSFAKVQSNFDFKVKVNQKSISPEYPDYAFEKTWLLGEGELVKKVFHKTTGATSTTTNDFHFKAAYKLAAEAEELIQQELVPCEINSEGDQEYTVSFILDGVEKVIYYTNTETKECKYLNSSFSQKINVMIQLLLK